MSVPSLEGARAEFSPFHLTKHYERESPQEVKVVAHTSIRIWVDEGRHLSIPYEGEATGQRVLERGAAREAKAALLKQLEGLRIKEADLGWVESSDCSGCGDVPRPEENVGHCVDCSSVSG